VERSRRCVLCHAETRRSNQAAACYWQREKKIVSIEKLTGQGRQKIGQWKCGFGDSPWVEFPISAS
jgi:hypothetical protein